MLVRTLAADSRRPVAVPEVPLHAPEMAPQPCSLGAGLDEGVTGDVAEPSDEREWAERFAAGDAAAAQELVERFQPRVTRLVHRLLAWPSDVADVVQDVFVAALDARSRFRGQAKLQTWLVRITINTCRAHNRRRWLRQRLFAAWSSREHGGHELRRPETARVSMLPASVGQLTSASPERAAIDQERARSVRAAVAGLPQKQREVVVLHYLEGMTAAEVAESLGIRTNAVEVRLSRARKQLSQALAQLAGEIP